jgi:hypothetical protein
MIREGVSLLSSLDAMLDARLSRVLLQRAPASSGVLRCSGPPCSPGSRSSFDMCMRMCMLSRAADLPVCACVHPNPKPIPNLNPNPNLLPVCRRHRVPHGRAAARRALEGLAPPASPRRAAGVARAVRKAGHAIGKRPSAPVARALAGRPRAPCGSSYTQCNYGRLLTYSSLFGLKIKSSMRTLSFSISVSVYFAPLVITPVFSGLASQEPREGDNQAA